MFEWGSWRKPFWVRLKKHKLNRDWRNVMFVWGFLGLFAVKTSTFFDWSSIIAKIIVSALHSS